jgi:hypothetical protein
MKFSINEIAEKSPKQLSDMKKYLIDRFRYQEAVELQEYITHCMQTSKLVKRLLSV